MHFVTMADATQLSDILRKKHGVDFGVVCLVSGNPHDAVNLVSAKNLKKS